MTTFGLGSLGEGNDRMLVQGLLLDGPPNGGGRFTDQAFSWSWSIPDGVGTVQPLEPQRGAPVQIGADE